MKDSDYPKFELVRGEISIKVLQAGYFTGIVTDTELKIPGVPVFGFHETENAQKFDKNSSN
ncbi:MAG: hypothetical protein ACLVG5_02205 [Clostridium sp.]